tara:strand:- start:520 stop:1086 length:567 start_codon:yes stop_codon:yes gene_type:complete
MKKLIIFLLLVLALLIVVGCEELTEEEKEILGKDGAAIAGQAYNQAGVQACKRDNECWQSLLNCYRAECGDAQNRDACIDSCLARAQGAEEDEAPECPNLWCPDLMNLLVGETDRWSPLEGPGKDVTLQIVGQEAGQTWIRVDVDGILSERINQGEIQVVNGLNVRYIGGLYQDYAGGVHSATLCLPE